MGQPVTALQGRNGFEWAPPVPLSSAPALPDFPVDALPQFIGDQVAAVAEALQTPVDLPGSLALAALSTAAGGRAVVAVRPGWTEPVNIYTVVVAEPSERKSPVFTAMITPIYDLERTLRADSADTIEAARVHRRALDTAATKAEQTAAGAKGDERDNALAEAVEAALAAAAQTVPVEPKLVVDDITPEKVSTVLADQGGRLAILSDEGQIFAIIAGRYSGEANTNVFLKGYTGTQLRVDRHSRPDELVEHPALTMGLTVQPAIIDQLGKTSLLRGSGFLARILYSFPASKVGTRLARANPVPEAVSEAYNRKLHTIAHNLYGWNTEPAVFRFAAGADDLMAALQDDIEPKLDPRGGQWAHMSDWGGKLAGQTARIAGLLHAAHHPDNPWDHEVTAVTFADATRIGEYYSQHALAIFDQLTTDDIVEKARKILGWITRKQPGTFTKRDAYNATRCKDIAKASDIDDALVHLEDLGHIAQQPALERRPGQRGQAPSPAYWTHPVYRPPAG